MYGLDLSDPFFDVCKHVSVRTRPSSFDASPTEDYSTGLLPDRNYRDKVKFSVVLFSA
jgi:hypothetical protein